MKEKKTEYLTLFSGERRRCIGCGKCVPCPKGIEIPEILRLLRQAMEEEAVSEELRAKYSVLQFPAGRCVACKRCESRCKNDVMIVKQMRLTRRVFGR